MWEHLTPADIERAKAHAAEIRRETLKRHAEELRVLDTDEAEFEILEGLIARFTKKYMGNLEAALPTATTAAPMADRMDVVLPDAKANDEIPPRLRVQHQLSPNFGLPVRRVMRG